MLPKSFYTGRDVPRVHHSSDDYLAWLKQEVRKCILGWTDGGYSITGRMYFYLNFWKIERRINKEVFFDFPLYTFYIHDVFDHLDLCDRTNKGFLWVGGRGCSKSYVVSSVVGHQYTFYERSECFLTGSAVDNVQPLMDKTISGLDNLPDGLYHNRLVNTTTNVISGELTKLGKKLGFQSEIRMIAFDKKADKTRGTRPRIQVFEEAGSWNGSASLVECYDKSTGSWYVDNKLTVLPIVIGTGGEMTSGGSIDLKRFFNEPDARDFLSFPDPDNPKKSIGYFTPAHYTFFDAECNKTYIEPNKRKAVIEVEVDNKRREFEAKRAKMIQSGDMDKLYQEKQEFPFTYHEAFLIKGSNIFNREKLEIQLKSIALKSDSNLLGQSFLQVGDLDWVDDAGNITKKITQKVKFTHNPDGIFRILEHPKNLVNYRIDKQEAPKIESLQETISNRLSNKVVDLSNQDIPYGLYVSGCDSFDADIDVTGMTRSDKPSNGSIYMYKRLGKYSDMGGLPVAECTYRPNTAVEFYEATLKLNCYYNAMMLFEHTKIGIKQWYEANRLDQKYLMRAPKTISRMYNDNTPHNSYGLTMPLTTKRHLEKVCRDYIEDNYDKIFFESLIRELLLYEQQSNKYDRAIAFFLCLICDGELYFIDEEEAEISMQTDRVLFKGFSHQKGIFG